MIRMASRMSCKVLMALVISTVLGLEGISSALTIRRQDWETSEEDLREEGRSLRTARSHGRFATFMSGNGDGCWGSANRHAYYAGNGNGVNGCFKHPPTLLTPQYHYACLESLPECLEVKVYPDFPGCRGKNSTFGPSDQLSKPFEAKSFEVIDVCGGSRNPKRMESSQDSLEASPEKEFVVSSAEETNAAEEGPIALRPSLGPLRLFQVQLRELQRMQREARRL